jgi:hypothetical protein
LVLIGHRRGNAQNTPQRNGRAAALVRRKIGAQLAKIYGK